MSPENIQILIAMGVYLAVVVGIGVLFAKKANENSDNFFLGGRTLGPWVAAMSAEASDMSGWLLMGLPGVAYWCGITDAFWTAIGLAIGTYINWLVVSKRLRNYSIVNQSITIPEFISNRFKENKKIILSIASVFILIFFTVYAASCFVTCGKLFSALFGFDYKLMMIIGAVVVILYTLMGGFLAESISDFIQGIVMIVALIAVVTAGVINAGGFSGIIDNVKSFPGFLEFFATATPTLGADETTQLVVNNIPQFGGAASYGILTILSTMSWGLGYFGMPQVLLRFMGIRKTSELKKSRRIAVIWVLISLVAAVFIGIMGRALYPTDLLTASSSENVFILLSTKLMPPLVAGLMMAGILAATMSSSDSYLLIAASAFAKDLFKGVIRKKASDKQVMSVSRIILIVISLLGVIIALDENSVIFNVVSFAWAGFGATFGPIILFSLFWKRTTRSGAVAGMLSGGITVFIWKLLLKPTGVAVLSIYELLPAFIISCIAIVAVSLLSKKPSAEIEKDFDAAKTAAFE